MKFSSILVTTIIASNCFQLATSKNHCNKLNLRDVVEALPDVDTLLDAYDREDYVMVGIKLIDLVLKIDPPDLDSNRLIQLLIKRRYLLKIYPHYLCWHPSKRPSTPSGRLHIHTVSDTMDAIDDIISALSTASRISISVEKILKIGIQVLNSLIKTPNKSAHTTRKVERPTTSTTQRSRMRLTSVSPVEHAYTIPPNRSNDRNTTTESSEDNSDDITDEHM